MLSKKNNKRIKRMKTMIKQIEVSLQKKDAKEDHKWDEKIQMMEAEDLLSKALEALKRTA